MFYTLVHDAAHGDLQVVYEVERRPGMILSLVRP